MLLVMWFAMHYKKTKDSKQQHRMRYSCIFGQSIFWTKGTFLVEKSMLNA